MLSLVLEDINDLRVKEKDMPQVNSDEALVRVHACGICGSDIPRSYKDGAHNMPLVIGHEFSGEVVKAEEASLVGKRVGIFPLIPCGECESCKKKAYEMCKDYSYLGSRRDGGFAEYVTVPKWNLIELPENVTYEQAAMLEPMAVAVHAIRKAGLLSVVAECAKHSFNKDIFITVCGQGTIGKLIVMFLKDAGYTNIHSLTSKTELRDPTNGRGIDVFFECVGKNETINEAIDLTAPGGTVCMVGNPLSDVSFSQQTYWKVLRNQLKVVGTWNSSFLGCDDECAINDDWHYVISRLSKGTIHPEEFITHRFSLSDIEKGFHVMRDKTESYTKVMAIM